MNKALLLFLTIFMIGFNNHNLFAQKNFLPGFVVIHENDTTYGWINYRNWAKNPTTISFKRDSTAPGQEYDPTQIQAFQVAGDRYISREISIDKTPGDVGELIISPKIERDKVFLLTYLRGKASLFYYRNEKPHFYIVKDSAISELVSRKLLKYQDGKRIAFEQELYKTQLRNYFMDCPDIYADIDDLAYKRNDIISLFQKYNKCIGSPILYVKDKIKPRVEFRIISGFSISQPTLSTKGYGKVDTYNQSFDPSLGVSFNIIFPRNRGK